MRIEDKINLNILNWGRNIFFAISFFGLLIVQIISLQGKYYFIYTIISSLGIWALVIAMVISDYKIKKLIKEKYKC